MARRHHWLYPLLEPDHDDQSDVAELAARIRRCGRLDAPSASFADVRALRFENIPTYMTAAWKVAAGQRQSAAKAAEKAAKAAAYRKRRAEQNALYAREAAENERIRHEKWAAAHAARRAEERLHNQRVQYWIMDGKHAGQRHNAGPGVWIDDYVPVATQEGRQGWVEGPWLLWGDDNAWVGTRMKNVTVYRVI